MKLVRRARYKLRRIIGFPDNALAVRLVGHRSYVGGLWDELGLLQLQFLKQQGLEPSDTLLDIACGSLRAGRHFIPYLDRGNYLGLDKNCLLIKRGKNKELSKLILSQKRPEFLVSASFEFEKFSKKASFSIAQSLFTHLTSEDIQLCLSNLFIWVEPGHKFYASFDPRKTVENPSASHSSKKFYYSVSALENLGRKAGWHTKYIGEWEHPRGLVMMEFIKT